MVNKYTSIKQHKTVGVATSMVSLPSLPPFVPGFFAVTVKVSLFNLYDIQEIVRVHSYCNSVMADLLKNSVQFNNC